MNRIPLPRFDRRSVRLALSYLAIIMILCLSFSVVFYRTSTDALNIELTIPQTDKKDASASEKGLTFGIGSSEGPKTAPVSSSAVSNLNGQLQAQMTTIRVDLIRRLVLLNISGLLVGGVLSYYLARRTLRPIEASMDAQSRFAADTSHELRTPLTVMQSEIEVTLNKPKLTLARAKSALASNHQEVIRLKELSEGLLRLAQNDDKPPRTFLRVELDKIVNDAINRMLVPAQTKHIVITDTLPKLSIKADAQSLTQALVILLDNAIKYSQLGSTVGVTGYAEGRHVYLQVHDEGLGIHKDDLPHIFERFYRADPSRSSQHAKGHGLGLSIAQKIISQHHGIITATSVPNKGSTFTIKLPL